MKFGTILADPPWPYDRTGNHGRLTGYADKQYELMGEDELATLPISQLAADDAVLLLWTTWPFVPMALRLVGAWGFVYVTGLPWIKTTHLVPGEQIAFPDQVPTFKPTYGVGYWMRGCSEVLVLAKRPRGRSVRTNWIGLLSENAKHSRKPASVYELAESFPAPRLEIFARRKRRDWTVAGNEVNDGQDIRDRLAQLLRRAEPDTRRTA